MVSYTYRRLAISTQLGQVRRQRQADGRRERKREEERASCVVGLCETPGSAGAVVPSFECGSEREADSIRSRFIIVGVSAAASKEKLQACEV